MPFKKTCEDRGNGDPSHRSFKKRAAKLLGIIKSLKNVFSRVSKRFEETDLFLHTAQTTYYAIFSSVPLFMLIIMFWRTLFPGASDRAVDIIKDAFSELSGKLPDDFWESVLSFDAPILSLTIATTLWSASKWAKSLSSGLRSIYGCPCRRNLIMRYVFSLMYTVMFIFVVLVSIGVIIYGNVFYARISSSGNGGAKFLLFLLGYKEIILCLVLSLLTVFVYKLMGSADYTLREHLPGALFSGAGWLVYSSFFSLYVRFYSRISVLYGSIGLILVIMLWVYNCMMILFLGAEINVYIKKRPIIYV